MNNIIAIAKNTFKETIRDRILYGILAFALLFLGSTIFISSLSLGEDIKVVKDLGLAGIYIFSIIITIFLGSSLIHKELEKRTIYIVLSKPVSSLEFILGKFFGLFLSVIANLLLMTTLYLALVAFKGGGFDYVSLFSILLLMFELAIFVAITLLFSVFTTPLASMLYSMVILYAGHSLSLLTKTADKSGTVFTKILAYGAYYIFPNLEKFNIRNSVIYGVIPDTSQIIFPLLYSIVLTVILLWLSTIALKKQEL
jgi:ABC-type transport system involved in multi-copper enzyme maturation permease subunit